jgi:phospholipase/carboxylesterase
MRKTSWRYIIYAAVIGAIIAVNYFGCSTGRKVAEERFAQPAASPDDINPYSRGAGKFLDLDLDGFMADARAAERSEDYSRAAQIYLFVLQHDVKNSWAMYRLAGCYGRLGEAELAAEYLERAYDMGIDNLRFINRDNDFDQVRGIPAFDDMVEHLTEDFESRMQAEGDMGFVETPRLLQYRIKLPENYDPERAYPLVLGLHGYGSNHEIFITLWDDDEPFIYVAPQGPYPVVLDEDLGFSWFVWDEDNPSLSRHSLELGEQYLFEVIDDVAGRYKISRKFILGFSQGCMIAYGVAISNPGEFDGLVAIGGRLGEDWLTEDQFRAASALDVLICHGDRDRSVRIGQARESRDLLAGYGYETTFFEFSGGHDIPDEAAATAAEWIIEHSG